ncbi:hypothetical protein AAVH_15152 [Aphelenchoides avenae]|nr:hypothetical protein AAVH_15152 [Aphelenchus avenae]
MMGSTAPPSDEHSTIKSTLTHKKLGVDAELLRYLFKEVGVRYESVRLDTCLDSLDGKVFSSTAVVLDACIAGLSSLAFHTFTRTEDEFDQHLADAKTILERSGATLRKLKCIGNGARYVEMLPPTTTLESLEP